MHRFILTLILALVLAGAGTSLAFDCSGAVPIVCNGPSLSGTIGIPPELTFDHCGTSSNYKHKIYSLTLATPQEISVSVTGLVGSLVNISIFDACNENLCLANSAPAFGSLSGVCLPAGTYTVSMDYLVELVQGYDIAVTCQSCSPVPAEGAAFGAIKSLYR